MNDPIRILDIFSIKSDQRSDPSIPSQNLVKQKFSKIGVFRPSDSRKPNDINMFPVPLGLRDKIHSFRVNSLFATVSMSHAPAGQTPKAAGQELPIQATLP